jgi:cyclophilin family peptidyl-prolyl cis-trans isomerase/HEAT repeat protein
MKRFLLLFALLIPGTARAQDEATVEALAPLLMAEDARQYSAAVFTRGLENPDPLVRRTAAMGIGRIRDRQGTALLLQYQTDPDSSVQTSVMFALGLLQDSTAVAPIMARFSAQPRLWRDAALEGITALAKTGGPSVAGFFSGILRGTQPLTVDSATPLTTQVAQELWRLGADAPVADLVPFARDTLLNLRRAAIYSLGRLRSKAAADALVLGTRDPDALVRAWSARSLTRSFADSAGLGADAMIGRLRALLGDEDRGVRTNAVRTLGTYAKPEVAGDITPLLDDQDVNVRVQVASTLGAIGGPTAAEALKALVQSHESFAARREALAGLARIDTAAFLEVVGVWDRSGDWEERFAAAQAWAGFPRGPHPRRPDLRRETDGRVIAAMLQAWSDGEPAPSAELAGAARGFLAHQDGAVRSVAADVLARVKDPADVPALARAYHRAERDSFPEAAISALAALDSIFAGGGTGAERVRQEFLGSADRPSLYLIRAWAEASWPEAAERWGPAYPVETGRTFQDYRDLARRYIVAPDSIRYPHVVLLTEQRTRIELELFGPEAPLTVANFLLLVDRHFFDGNSWHRVVPNFVVQDGDRRGDGWGGPGTPPIRDEINRRRYGSNIVGMALSGPDTGGSQWFITLSPQPHLDGIYTIFGRVVTGSGFLSRVTQGDRITSIRR